jgi:hypothetical protein
MRDAQLAKVKPAIKNKAPTAIRSVVLFVVIDLIVVSIYFVTLVRVCYTPVELL